MAGGVAREEQHERRDLGDLGDGAEGMRDSQAARACGFDAKSAVRGVSTGPGATAFTRTPAAASSIAAVRVRASTAALVAS